MNEAKPQDGGTVKGYRTLTADDIAQMNELKKIGRDFCEKLDIERSHLSLEVAEANSNQAGEHDNALRCLAIASTKMQEACKWACRVVDVDARRWCAGGRRQRRRLASVSS